MGLYNATAHPPSLQKGRTGEDTHSYTGGHPAKRGSRAPRPVDLRCGLSEVGLAHNVVVPERVVLRDHPLTVDVRVEEPEDGWVLVLAERSDFQPT